MTNPKVMCDNCGQEPAMPGTRYCGGCASAFLLAAALICEKCFRAAAPGRALCEIHIAELEQKL